MSNKSNKDANVYATIAANYAEQLNDLFELDVVISIDHENEAYDLRIGEFLYQFDTAHELCFACQIARNTKTNAFI